MHLAFASTLAALGAVSFFSHAPVPATAPQVHAPPSRPAILDSLVGSWRGTTKTWTAGRLLDESPVAGEIAPVLDGRFLRHAYSGSMRGQPRTGEELIAFDAVEQRFQVTWIDSFHMSHAILVSEGRPKPGGFQVTGSYRMVPGQDAWGWRTEYERSVDGRLVITAYNITPDGVEEKSVETVYHRVEPEAAGPEAAARAFVAALDGLDLEGVRATLAEDVTLFAPHGDALQLVSGRLEVMREFERRFGAWTAGGGRVPLGLAEAATDFHVQRLGLDVALVTWRLEREGSPGRRTACLALREGGWRLVHLHSSNLAAR